MRRLAVAHFLGFALLSLAAPAVAQQKAPRGPNPVEQIAAWLEPDQTVVYKEVDGRSLDLHLFNAKPAQFKKARPCFVSFHGGGWTGGEPRRMYPYAAWFAERGWVGISVEYRLKSGDPVVKVEDCVKDARSALRHIKSHARELGIDPARITVSGASAGGHLAAATALFHDVNADTDDLSIDPTPAALMLCYPVIDTSAKGYGQGKIGADWERLSPLHQVRAGLPPTLILHGTGDNVTPFAGAAKFTERMKELGNHCELIAHEGGPHGHIMFDGLLWDESMAASERFLREVGVAP